MVVFRSINLAKTPPLVSIPSESGLTSSRTPSGYRRDHAVALTGLTAGATYVLRAKSTDRAGNVTLAPEIAFRLP